jgi:NAD-dependent dihydropyrimidine dehydrogenase PreA subunit
LHFAAETCIRQALAYCPYEYCQQHALLVTAKLQSTEPLTYILRHDMCIKWVSCIIDTHTIKCISHEYDMPISYAAGIWCVS